MCLLRVLLRLLHQLRVGLGLRDLLLRLLYDLLDFLLNVRVRLDLKLAHVEQGLLVEVLGHHLGHDPRDVPRDPDQFALTVTNTNRPVIRLELLRPERLAGLRRAAHDVRQAGDLINVVDQFFPQRNQPGDRRHNHIDRQPDDHVLGARIAKRRPIRNGHHDLIVRVRLDRGFDGVANLASAGRIEPPHLHSLAQRGNTGRQFVDFFQLVLVEQHIRHRDQRAPLRRAIGRLRTGEEALQFRLGVDPIKHHVHARRDPDHLFFALVPDFPNAGLGMAVSRAVLLVVLADLVFGLKVFVTARILKAGLHLILGQP